MARAKTPLEIVEAPTAYDSVFDLALGDPYAKVPGVSDDEDLVCGLCEAVLLKGWSLARVFRVLLARNPVVLICPECRAFSRLPVQIRL